MSTLAKPVKPIKDTLFEYVETEFGTWKIYDPGKDNFKQKIFGCQPKYREFASHAEIFGKPLFTFASGFHPETKRMAVADGFIAIGQKAKGVVAIGQFCNGYVFALGQFCTSRIFAIGQFTVAPLAIGQFGLALFVVSQFGIAGLGLFQIGINLIDVWPW